MLEITRYVTICRIDFLWRGQSKWNRLRWFLRRKETAQLVLLFVCRDGEPERGACTLQSVNVGWICWFHDLHTCCDLAGCAALVTIQKLIEIGGGHKGRNGNSHVDACISWLLNLTTLLVVVGRLVLITPPSEVNCPRIRYLRAVVIPRSNSPLPIFC